MTPADLVDIFEEYAARANREEFAYRGLDATRARLQTRVAALESFIKEKTDYEIEDAEDHWKAKGYAL